MFRLRLSTDHFWPNDFADSNRRKQVVGGVRCCALILLVVGFYSLTMLPTFGYQNFLRKARIAPFGQPDPVEQTVESAVSLPEYRIRVVWGGGEAKAWRGNLQLRQGLLQNATPLGLEPDAGAALDCIADQLSINATRRSAFFGFDVDIKDSNDNQITFYLIGNDGQPFEQDVDLSPLLSASSIKHSIQLSLDESGNRLEITRAPGDKIPVSITRPHLVFHPGEDFEFGLKSFVVPGKNDSVQLQVETISNSSGKVLDTQTIPLSSPNGLVEYKDLIQLGMPKEEGVYNVRLSIRSDSLARRLNLDKPAFTRTIQTVVVRSGPLDASLAHSAATSSDAIVLWKEVYDTEQVRKQWLDRLPSMDPFRLVGDKTEKLRNEGVKATEVDGQVWTEFAAGGWQAVPIQVMELNQPHIIEIEYLDDGPITMGFSVLQPDASGQVQPFGVDSGINIPELTGVSPTQSVRRHRIFFWPQHKSPYLLFANRHASRSVKIGKIRVLAGPKKLASSNDVRPNDKADTETPTRQLMAFYEKPLFAENFASNQSLDNANGQSHHDWQTFMDGADRWTQYLKANGYTGAMIVVAGDGSSLYPSDRINPNPRFDNGIFGSTGADPIRKDVVELLLRIFQREGLQLVPVFHFNHPLASLEKQIASNPQQANGITLTGLRGINRYPEFQNSATSVSYYNPLDPRVRMEFDAVVDEFLTRYQNHEALGGVGMLLSRDSLQVLPGQTWGVDSNTLRRFAVEANIDGNDQPNATPASSFDDTWLLGILASEQRKEWLAWRQLQMGQWIHQTEQRIQTSGQDRKLFLLGSDMLRTQDAFSTLAPSLRRNADITDALARIGFPADTIAGNSNIVFLRPFELAPEKSLADERLNLQLQRDNPTGKVLQSLSQGALFTHRASWAEFRKLQQQRLFADTQRQPIMRIQPLTPAGDWARHRFVDGLVNGDAKYLIDGGWLSTLGQEEHLSKMIETYTRLPAIEFQDLEVAASEGDSSTSLSGLVIRQANHQGRNYFYIANPTPWPLQAVIQLTGRNTVIESLGPDEFLFDQGAELPQMTVNLKPFSMRAGYVADGVLIAGCQVEPPAEVAGNLQDRLNSLLSKASLAAQAQPLEALSNPSFEITQSVARNVGQNSQPSPIVGWNFDASLQNWISVSGNSASSGEKSLRMSSDGRTTWIRSNPIEFPETGRLSISVMIRTDRPEVQPPLRISIQGNDGRQVYYRYGTVGDQERLVSGEWQEYAVHFDDLPLTSDTGLGRLEIGFDLMGEGHVEIDNVRIFDRWLDQQDSRSLTQLLALAGFQLNSQRDPQRCRQILNGYWPRFLEEFFPDPPQATESTASRDENRSSR